MMAQRLWKRGFIVLLGWLFCSCSSADSGDSQTNWLRSCRTDSECGDLRCLCGLCTLPCSDTAACSGERGASCVNASDSGAIAQCSGRPPAAPGLCLRDCSASACAAGQMCVAGVCAPVPTTLAEVTIDPSVRHQQLVGFGASIAYGEGQITAHPQKSALYQVIFGDLGLGVLRFRNRYGHQGDDDLTTAGQLYGAARDSLGRAPVVLLSSWSPPPELKANNALLCSGNARTCTLSRNAAGAFDYAGFANYWLNSVGAYARVGIAPDYIGLQNNPNWVPSAAELGEACRFMPVEGAATVTINGSAVTVPYPGFAEAQAATGAAFATLPTRPKMLAPETSDFGSVADYLPSLDRATTDALGHQFYGVDPSAVDMSGLSALGQLESQFDRPVFITEMQADGFATAVLIHYATVVEGASAYLQSALTGSLTGPTANTQALVGLDATTFAVRDPYHAMRHFARHTQRGWVRVEAQADVNGVLVSAWLSPNEDQLTVVLVNAGSVELNTRLALPGRWSNSEVTRSVFSGTERSAPLGKLAPERVIRVPAQAVVTVALTR